MQTVIYADVLVSVNIFITYIILVCTRLAAKQRCFGRLMSAAASVIGGFSSLIVLAGDIGIFFSILFRVVTAAVICAVAFVPRSLKVFLRCFAAFFLVSFIFGGLMFAVEAAFMPHGLIFYNGTVYFDISVSSLALMCLFCYGVFIAADHFIKRRAADGTVYELTVFFRGRSASVNALYDTGNTAADTLSGRPVVLVSLNAAAPLFTFDEFKYLKNEDVSAAVPPGLEKSVRLTVCRSVGGEVLLKSFLPDKITVSDGKTETETADCCIALTGDALFGGEYGALLNAASLERSRI